jgi:peptidoglycan hydrolase CwlO-like protein
MLEGYFSLFVGITGAVVGVVGAVFTVRSTLIKSNVAAQKDYNDTLTAQLDNANQALDNLKKEHEDYVRQIAQLQGENKTLREIATQTPEIIQLTKEVSRNNREMGAVAKEIARLTSAIEQHFVESTKS